MFRSVLPPAVVQRLDLATLTALQDSFVDAALKDRETDLLFSVALAGRPALIYLLLEHQSTVDARMPFRLLRYMVLAWEAFLAREPKATRLPAIIPVVVHHSRAGWTAPRSLQGLLDVDAATLAAVGEHVVRFTMVLDDLGAVDDAALQSRALAALGRLVLLCLKHARDAQDLGQHLVRWAALVHQVLATPHGQAALVSVLRYALAVNNQTSAQELRRRVAELGPKAEASMVTAADLLRQEGRKQGLEQGLEQGRRAVLRELLADRFGELPAKAERHLQSADEAELRAMAHRVLTAASLAEVLQGRSGAPGKGRRRRL